MIPLPLKNKNLPVKKKPCRWFSTNAGAFLGETRPGDDRNAVPPILAFTFFFFFRIGGFGHAFPVTDGGRDVFFLFRPARRRQKHDNRAFTWIDPGPSCFLVGRFQPFSVSCCWIAAFASQQYARPLYRRFT